MPEGSEFHTEQHRLTRFSRVCTWSNSNKTLFRWEYLTTVDDKVIVIVVMETEFLWALHAPQLNKANIITSFHSYSRSHLRVGEMDRKYMPSIDAHLFEEQSCQISYWSDLKRWSLKAFFEERCPNKKKKNNNREVAIWHQFLIQKWGRQNGYS